MTTLLALLLAATPAAAPRPNVSLVLADDLGFADLGCYGGEIRTPHLDRLAAGGLRFRQFYNGTRCSPTRASLTDVFGDYSLDILAEARKAKKPFFQYLAFNAPHLPLHAKPEDIWKYADADTGGWDRLRETRLAEQIELGLLTKGTPLSPRSGFTSRRDFLRTGENPAWDGLPADRRADLARRMAVYAAMVECMDRNVGRVVDDLRAHGELDNTLVLFLSDNGACAEWDPFGFDGGSGPKNVLHTGDALAASGAARPRGGAAGGGDGTGRQVGRLGEAVRRAATEVGRASVRGYRPSATAASTAAANGSSSS